ncbi:MAG: hypothetical protein ACI8QZ_002338 [Chlamydiales bacterium]|jgi:hypothetical protein
MDFLLECIGFPPNHDPDELIDLVCSRGEGVPWRGDPENHRRLDLGNGLELRLDREAGQDFWTLLPHYQVPVRLRVAVESIRRVPDSPFDALLVCWAAPPSRRGVDEYDIVRARGDRPGIYPLSTWLTDAKRLPEQLGQHHVLAIQVAGFALDISFVGPNTGGSQESALTQPHGAHIAPLGDADSPGGCSDVSLRIREVRHLRNPLTGRLVDLVIADAPERPMYLFVSPWQLGQSGLPLPRPGWRIEGTFFFTGRIAGGLPTAPKRTKTAFG